jgi:hypothetical protein
MFIRDLPAVANGHAARERPQRARSAIPMYSHTVAPQGIGILGLVGIAASTASDIAEV